MQLLIKYISFILFSAAFLFPAAQAEQRSADMHTAIPETLVKQRKDWGFDLSLGGSRNEGNVDRANLYGELVTFRKWDWSMLYLQTKINVSGSGDPFTRNQNQGVAMLRYDHGLTENWRIFLFNTNAYNEFLGLKYRSTMGIGPWLQLGSGPVKNGFSIAAAYEFVEFSQAPIERTARLSFRNFFECEISETSHLGMDLFYVPAFQDMNNFRLTVAPFLEARIVGDSLSLKVIYIFEKDSRPKPGIKTNDSDFVTALTLKLGE